MPTPSSASSSIGASTRCRRIRQRVVPAQHVPAGATTCTSITSRPTDRSRKFGYKDFIPKFKAEKYDPVGLGDAVPQGGREVRCPGGRASRRLPDVRLQLHRLERGQDGTQARSGRRTGRGGPQAGHALRCLLAPRRALVVLRRRHEVRLRREGSRRMPGSTAPRCRRRRPTARANRQPSAAYMDDWLARTSEIVDKYQPELIWFDWWIEQPVFQPYLQKFAAFYYNRGAQWNKGGVAINYKNKSFPDNAAVLDIERGKLDKSRPYLWQTDTSIGLKSWGYIEGEEFRSADSLIDDLIDIVSKNGVLLLNIGPRAGRDDSGRSAEDPARYGQVARGERRSRLRHATLEGLRRGPDGGALRAASPTPRARPSPGRTSVSPARATCSTLSPSIVLLLRSRSSRWARAQGCSIRKSHRSGCWAAAIKSNGRRVMARSRSSLRRPPAASMPGLTA